MCSTANLSHQSLHTGYMVGSEANCISSLCCRDGGTAASNETSVPAPWFGAYLWYVSRPGLRGIDPSRSSSDSPLSLVTATLQAIPVLAGTENNPFDWTIYTGDLLSHDPFNELSRYVVCRTVEKITLMSQGVYPLYGGQILSLYCCV